MKEIINSPKAPNAIGPYNHAVAVKGLVFTSGQLGIDPATGQLPDGVEAQALQALVNVESVLAAAGASMIDVVKTTIFMIDLKDFSKVNAIYAERFGSEFPARSCVQVAGLPMGGLIEIEAVACLGADEA